MGLSQRRACRLAGQLLSTCRYSTQRPAADAQLSLRITELALERRRFGYRRIWHLLRREGLHVNHKRAYRIYHLNGLGVKRRRRRKSLATEWLPLLRPGPEFTSRALYQLAYEHSIELRWDGVRSLANALEMLRRQVAITPAPQWVRVIGGFTEHQFAEKRLPTLDEIDRIASDTPVFLLHLYDRELLNPEKGKVGRLKAEFLDMLHCI